jgi:hypothetical protein
MSVLDCLLDCVDMGCKEWQHFQKNLQTLLNSLLNWILYKVRTYELCLNAGNKIHENIV